MATLSRFRGSLVGAVLGDCIGAIYECEGNVKLKDVLKTVKDLETSWCLYHNTDFVTSKRSVTFLKRTFRKKIHTPRKLTVSLFLLFLFRL